MISPPSPVVYAEARSRLDALAKPVGALGLWSDAFVSVPPALASKAFVADFVSVIREQCARTLDGIKLLA